MKYQALIDKACQVSGLPSQTFEELLAGPAQVLVDILKDESQRSLAALNSVQSQLVGAKQETQRYRAKHGVLLVQKQQLELELGQLIKEQRELNLSGGKLPK